MLVRVCQLFWKVACRRTSLRSVRIRRPLSKPLWPISPALTTSTSYAQAILHKASPPSVSGPVCPSRGMRLSATVYATVSSESDRTVQALISTSTTSRRGWDWGLGLGLSPATSRSRVLGCPIATTPGLVRKPPAGIYSQTEGRTTLPLILAGNQTAIVVLKHTERPQCASVRRSDCPVQIPTQPSGKRVLVCPGTAPCHVHLSNSRRLSVPPSWTSAPLALTNWTLTL